MNRSTTFRRILLNPPSLRTFLMPRAHIPTPRAYSSSVQSITQTSFWASLIPKPLRRSRLRDSSKLKSKEWNPATFFIFIFLLIGSMSIQMIALKNTHTAFERRATAKIGLLKEVIERIQRGEEVDVEGLLGTGDAKREKEWEEVLQEIEKEDQAWEDAERRRPNRRSSSNNDNSLARAEILEDKSEPAKSTSKAPRGFY